MADADVDALGHMSCALLEGLAEANRIWFSLDPGEHPWCLVHAGIAYVDPTMCREIQGDGFCQKILCAKALLEKKVGTCADLSSYVAAWLRHYRRDDCEIVMEQQVDAYGAPVPYAYHAYVRSSSMGVVDPSKDIQSGNCRCSEVA